jgi:hypothetical protein
MPSNPFPKGNKLSKCRKLGSRNKRTIFEQAILDREDELTEALIEHHLRGNAAAVQAVAKLLAPSRRRWRSAPLQVPEVKTGNQRHRPRQSRRNVPCEGSVTEHEGRRAQEPS